VAPGVVVDGDHVEFGLLDGAIGEATIPPWHVLLGGGGVAGELRVSFGVEVPQAVVSVVPRPPHFALSRVPPFPVERVVAKLPSGRVLVLAQGPLRADGHVQPHLEVREEVLVGLRGVAGVSGQQEGPRPGSSGRTQGEAALLVQQRVQESFVAGPGGGFAPKPLAFVLRLPHVVE